MQIALGIILSLSLIPSWAGASSDISGPLNKEITQLWKQIRTVAPEIVLDSKKIKDLDSMQTRAFELAQKEMPIIFQKILDGLRKGNLELNTAESLIQRLLTNSGDRPPQIMISAPFWKLFTDYHEYPLFPFSAWHFLLPHLLKAGTKSSDYRELIESASQDGKRVRCRTLLAQSPSV